MPNLDNEDYDDDDFIELMRVAGEEEEQRTNKRARTDVEDQKRMPPPPPRFSLVVKGAIDAIDLGNAPFESFGFDLVVKGAIDVTIKHRSIDSPIIEDVKFEIVNIDKINESKRSLSDIKAVWMRHDVDWNKRDCVIFRGISATTLAPLAMAANYVSNPSFSKIVLTTYMPPAVRNVYKNPFTDSFVDAPEKLNWIKRDNQIRTLTNALDIRVATKYVIKLAEMFEKRRKMQQVFNRGTRFDNHVAYMSEEIVDVEDAIMKLYMYKIHIDSWSALFKDDKVKIGPFVTKVQKALIKMITAEFGSV